nr:hypothetical protein BaRGS_023490 [Batillaria attramentaria]
MNGVKQRNSDGMKLELKTMELQLQRERAAEPNATNNNDQVARAPKLPAFNEHSDKMDAYLERGKRDVTKVKKRQLRKTAAKYTIREDVLYHDGILVAKRNQVPEILQEFHDNYVSGGHLGMNKTYKKAKLPFDVTGDANEQDLNEEIMDTMKGIHEEVKNKIGENISRAQKKQKEYYDSRACI